MRQKVLGKSELNRCHPIMMKAKSHFAALATVILGVGSLHAATLIQVDATNLGVSDGTAIADLANPGTAGAFSTILGTVSATSHPSNNNPGVLIQGAGFDGAKMTSANTMVSTGMVGNQNYSVTGWVWNATAGNEEAFVSWGHRGGPTGSNSGFHQGTHPTFGAIGHWGGGALGNPAEPDVGWGNNGADINATFGQWAHLAYVWDGSTDRVYIDGVLSAWEDHMVLNPHQTFNDGSPTLFALGSESDAGNINNTPIAFSGTVARVTVLDTVMSDVEVLAAFNADAPYFFDGIPEPTSSLLAVIGVGLLGLRRRR